MSKNTLEPGTILQGTTYTYKIEEVLGSGSFGITYLATTKVSIKGPLGAFESTIPVAIKEFFMEEINGRRENSVTSGNDNGGMFDKYKKKFIKEAQTLSTLNHNNIIKVLESFSANNTYYYTMEYCDGGSIDTLISSKNGIGEEESIKYAEQIAEALTFMHKNKMLHLDLKPGNVMLNSKGNVVLIDFGLSKQYDQNGNPESSTSVGGGTPGYAPIEQANYTGNEKEFPVKMDIYALGATMYKMLTGRRPPEASVLLNDGFPQEELMSKGVSSRTIRCIMKAMAPLKKDRYSTASDFISALKSNEPEVPIDDESTYVKPDINTDEGTATRPSPTINRNPPYQGGYNRPEPQNKPTVEYLPDGVSEFENNLGSNNYTKYLYIAIFIIIGIVTFLIFKNCSGDNESLVLNAPPKNFFAEKDGLSSYPMVKVNSGEFYMGVKNGTNNPLHKVMVNDFYIGIYEVSQGLWYEIMGTRPAISQPTEAYNGGEFTQEQRDLLPVENISFKDAQKFVEKLRQKTGKNFSLPTEAQWEYAARGGGNGQKNPVYAIESGNPGDAFYVDRAAPYFVELPTSKNSLGIYNMSGNVAEWCLDYYDKSYYKSSPKNNPLNEKRSEYRVVRGGSYCSGSKEYITVYSRDKLRETSKNDEVGLRLVLNP